MYRLGELTFGKDYLYEMTIAKIKSFRVPSEVDDQGEILKLFEFVYELEYKYHALLDKRFLGIPQRLDNIVSIIEAKALEAVPPLMETFEVVYSEWLEAHALTDPAKWAEGQMRIFDEYGENYNEGLDLMLSAMKTYTRDPETLLTDKAITEMPQTKEALYEFAALDKVDRLQLDLEDLQGENLEPEEFVEMYSNLVPDLEGLTTVEEIEEVVENTGPTDIEGNLDEDDVREMVENMEGIVETIKAIEYSTVYLDIVDTLKEAYQYAFFPVWFAHWEAEGIVETRKRVEKVYEMMQGYERKSVREQLMILNIAKNTNHQTGSMMDHYEDKWGVSEEDLEALTDTDVRTWDAELIELGVEMK